MRRTIQRTILIALFLCTVPLTTTSASWGGEEADGTATTTGSLSEAVTTFTRAPVPTALRFAPSEAEHALIKEVNELSAAVGFEQDVTADVEEAELPGALAARLAAVVEDLSDCYAITDAHWDQMPRRGDALRDIAYNGSGLDPAAFLDIRRCAEDLWASTSQLELATSMGADGDFCQMLQGGPLDLWPVLVLDAVCDDNVYQHDYMLIVDLGGNDVYANNVGSNMIDVKHPPPKFGHPIYHGPAQGCQQAIEGLLAADCIPAAAVLFDRQGADTYGVKQFPDVDRACTSDNVIRRMLIGGVGFLGTGILLDSGLEGDRYTGKTVSLGAGHIFGVGLLMDRFGSDSYSAIRNSEGFALVGGLGLLHDQRGNDRYGYYLPSGGVIDDTNQCDDRLRFLQGAGNVAGPTLGLLLDGLGDDVYVGGFSGDFEAPLGEGRGGSQGFGNNGATGVLTDVHGWDSYSIFDQTGSQGSPARGDTTIILPDATCQRSACSGGVFIDSSIRFLGQDPVQPVLDLIDRIAAP